jgi:hypothetical protein
VEGEVGLGLFLIGMGGWLIWLGLSSISDFRRIGDEPDDFYEVDHTDFYITIVGILLLMGIAAATLGILSLLA